VLAAQAAAAVKVAAAPDTAALGLGSNSPLPKPSTADEGLAAGLAPMVGAPEDMINKRVLVVGLIKQPAFNGEWGRVESYDAGLQRFVVRVTRDAGPPLLAKLRRENLLVPPTLALRFDDESKPSSGTYVEVPAHPPHRPMEPAFVPCAQAVGIPSSELVVASALPHPPEEMSAAAPAATAAPVELQGSAAEGCLSTSRDRADSGGQEAAEKWKPTLRHWWGEADLDSSGSATLTSGQKEH